MSPAVNEHKKKSLCTLIEESPLWKLKIIPRYSDKYMHRRESVSDHVWHLISLAMVVVPYLNKDAEQPLDLKEVIYRISVHDLDESGCIDIPRPFKYHSTELKELLDRVSIEILREKGVSENIIDDIQSAKDYSSAEGYFVKVFDTVQVGIVMMEELALGNSEMKKELPNVLEGIEYFIEVTDYQDIPLDSSIRTKMRTFLQDFYYKLEKFI